MTKLIKAWLWVKAHIVQLVIGVGALFFTALAIASRKPKELPVGKQAKLREALQEIAAKEGAAEQLEASAAAKQEDVDAAIAEVAESRRRVMEIQTGETLEGKSDEEVARMFADSGL